ncbi:Ribosome biogenesis GTPase A [Coccomyxa sp. Obi]|nr:Ribosome biogenesis GTPase A [Coccomyxa sp. Obi]
MLVNSSNLHESCWFSRHPRPVLSVTERGRPVTYFSSPTLLHRYALKYNRSSDRHSRVQVQALVGAELDEDLLEEYTGGLLEGQGRLVQWYPGHIARAERRLKEQLGMVDVVLEVRDARIPMSTCHSQLAKWCGTKPRLLLLNRVDMISDSDRAAWTRHFVQHKTPVLWTDGVSGLGVGQVRKAALDVSVAINAKRRNRGLMPRPVRAVMIGFPNVGKSALINRLLNRRVCRSAPKPGVTRDLKWNRLGGEFDLLDAPGIIPASFTDQQAAQRLAVCNDIGEASYVDSLIAASLLDTFTALPSARSLRRRLEQRYGVEFSEDMTAEDYIAAVAEDKCQGEEERAAQRLLKDFRSGALGRVALELPPGC